MISIPRILVGQSDVPFSKFFILIFCVVLASSFNKSFAKDYAIPDLQNKSAIDSFYAGREYDPFWNANRSRRRDLVRVLEDSWRHGLNPSVYRVQEIKQLDNARDADDLNRRELLMSSAYIKYMHDMTGPRFDTSRTIFQSSAWAGQIDAKEALSLLQQRNSVSDVLRSVEPKSKTYKALQRAMISYGRDAEINKGRIKALIVNMERLRWEDENKPDKFILVNIPSARLWAIEDNRVVTHMPVIVGRGRRPTYSFTSYATGMRFNPTWTIPPTIKSQDIVPKLINDPSYLSGKGVKLVDYEQGGRVIDPHDIDWSTVSASRLKTLGMIQREGRHNPLGQVRVLMSNPYNIYLHGTNNQADFESGNAAQSSGCVRMKYPEEIADFILKGKQGWSTEETRRVIAKGSMRDISAPEQIPVYITYYTIWLDEQGTIVFGEDIYKQDEKIIREIEKIDGFDIFVHNERAESGIANSS